MKITRPLLLYVLTYEMYFSFSKTFCCTELSEEPKESQIQTSRVAAAIQELPSSSIGD